MDRLPSDAPPQDDEHAFKRWLARNAEQVLAAADVGPGRNVLDYGCGRGLFTLAAARMVGSNGAVHAVDVSTECLDVVRQETRRQGLSNVATFQLDPTTDLASCLPRPVHTVLLYDVLQVVDDKARLLSALCDVLKPHGTLSVFPMHVGVDALLSLTSALPCLTVQGRQGMVLNFHYAGAISP